MYAANGRDKKYAAAQWMADALVEHGGRWKSMLVTWREKARDKEKEDSWEERHRRMDEKRKIRDDGHPKNTRRRLLVKQRVEVQREPVAEEVSQAPTIQLRRTARCDICDNDIVQGHSETQDCLPGKITSRTGTVGDPAHPEAAAVFTTVY